MSNHARAPLSLRVADWDSDRKALQAIRYTVFVEEQQVPVELEWDEFDTHATHFIASYNGQAVATARLKNDGQIGRMAVLEAFRGKGIGAALLTFVIETARSKNLSSLYLHAQVPVIGFYQQHGFRERGEIFMDANIPHREMVKNL
ncbi:MAG TPA: GNAT family N-acetyltransferase [Thiotrichales bacterium]|nr:GNAT family N-acetyltransferase [Thiotrichales bacterium]